MLEPWVWAVLLLLLGLALAVGDIFLPSGGFLAFLSFCSIVGAVVLAFMKGSSELGLGILVTALGGLPVVIILAFRYWPRTKIGRQVLLQSPTSEEVLPEEDRRESLHRLVGRVGRAKTKMLPNGLIAIDNHTYDAISDGTFVEPGERVRVVEIRGMRIVVEGLTDEPPSEADADPLARPMEWDVPDPFQTPPP
jgi:membrane-bound serine protease (ClpP class)